MTTATTVRIPITVKRAVTPNGIPPYQFQTKRGNRMRYRLQAELKKAAKKAVEDAGLTYPEGTRLTLDYVVAWEKYRRTMDKDNLIAGLKYCQDGIAEALGVNDRYIDVEEVTQIRDPEKKGYMEVTIRES